MHYLLNELTFFIYSFYRKKRLIMHDYLTRDRLQFILYQIL